MRFHLVNYANWKFKDQQALNSKSAIEVGNFDSVFSFGPSDIDSEFYSENRNILKLSKGNGYWLWKPYFICKALDQISDGDWLFYSDSGSTFVESSTSFFELMEKNRVWTVCFELFDKIERDWTHPHCMDSINRPAYMASPQRLASFIAMKKTDFNVDLAREYLRLCCEPGNLLDPQEFTTHRHDQSIWSILTKFHGLTSFRDPSQYGNPVKDYYTNSPYPQFINHHREKRLSMIEHIYRIGATIKSGRLLKRK